MIPPPSLYVRSKTGELGGVLIGTPAFAAYGNLLGIRFAGSSLRTQDVDIDQDPVVAVALLGDAEPSNVGEVLKTTRPPFPPIPALDPRKPSTSFSVRGKEMRVDSSPRCGAGSAKTRFTCRSSRSRRSPCGSSTT